MLLWYEQLLKNVVFASEFINFFFFIIIARIAQTNGRCQLTLPVDIPKNEPVYLVQHRNNFTIYQPSGQVNSFSGNENLYLFCPGKRNAIQIGGEQIRSNLTEVSCRSAKFVINDSADVNNLNSINCTKGVQADIIAKKQKCSTTGQVIDVGFKLTNNIFLPTFKICFDNTTWSPIWSKHVINGKSIKCNYHLTRF